MKETKVTSTYGRITQDTQLKSAEIDLESTGPLINWLSADVWKFIASMPSPENLLDYRESSEKCCVINNGAEKILKAQDRRLKNLIHRMGILNAYEVSDRSSGRTYNIIFFSDTQYKKFWSENFILWLMKLQLQKKPHLSLKGIIFEIWNIDQRLKNWAFGKSVNFGTEQQPFIREITKEELVSFFEFALSLQNQELVKQMWDGNRLLHETIQNLPFHKMILLLEKVLAQDQSPFIRDYISKIEDISLLELLLNKKNNINILSNVPIIEGQIFALRWLHEYMTHIRRNPSNLDLNSKIHDDEIDVARKICISPEFRPNNTPISNDFNSDDEEVLESGYIHPKGPA